MTRMNFFSTSLLIVLMAGLALGFVAPQDRADEILKQSKAKVQALEDFGAGFIYELAGPGLSGTISKEGTLKYQGGKYAVKMAEEAFFCDQENLWLYFKEDNTVNIMEYDPEEGMNIQALFELYETNAESRYEGIEQVNGQACHKVFMAIKDPGLDYSRATLWINQKTLYPAKALLINRKQTETVFQLNDFQANVGYPVSDFQFNQADYPGVEVYDER